MPRARFHRPPHAAGQHGPAMRVPSAGARFARPSSSIRCRARACSRNRARHGFHFWIRMRLVSGMRAQRCKVGTKRPGQAWQRALDWSRRRRFDRRRRTRLRPHRPRRCTRPRRRLDRLFGRHAHLGRTRRERRMACVRRCVVRRVRKPPRFRFDGPPRPAYALFARWMGGTRERRKPLG